MEENKEKRELKFIEYQMNGVQTFVNLFHHR